MLNLMELLPLVPQNCVGALRAHVAVQNRLSGIGCDSYPPAFRQRALAAPKPAPLGTCRRPSGPEPVTS